MSIDLAQQIAQFHYRYPGGSVTSELLMVHNDAYVVRAMAQFGAVTLATAMAANPDLEVAEDRAKARVLDCCLGGGKPEVLESSAAAQSQQSSQPLRQAPLRSQPEKPSDVESPIPREADSDLPPLDDTIPGLDDDMPPMPSLSPQSGQNSPDTNSTIDLLSFAAAPSPATPASPKRTSKPDLTAGMLAPKDLSDIIAKTSVELRRLGWTEEKGREHLQTVYGKRSRQQLTDPELVDFLHYLEQQSKPSSR